MAAKRRHATMPPIREFGAVEDAGARAHYADPAYYATTYRNRRHDIDYYVRLAREADGPVLEYGVGTGRIALHVARAGVEVTGVDLSQPMLDYFKNRLRSEPPRVRQRVRLELGDMRSFDARRRFALVYAPFNCVLHLYTRADMEAFLARVRAHLAPGGRFVFDFSVPQGEDLMRDPQARFEAPPVRMESGTIVRYSERFEYDRLRQLLLIWMEFTPESGEPWQVPLTHRQYFPREMEALLHYNGFDQIFFTADFSDLPADQQVDSMVVSCSARRERRAPTPRPETQARRRAATSRK